MSSFGVYEYTQSDHIKRWCLDNIDNQSCKCSDPFKPEVVTDQFHGQSWTMAHLTNVKRAQLAASTAEVVFLGDSITEGWMGTKFGLPYRRKKEIRHIFDSLFQKSHGGEFEGLALGIAGDRSPNLLWRMKNGEIPTTLHPKVWWLLIGTNDLGEKEQYCSEEVILTGILQVIRELKRLRPNAVIVVNGLLPRTDDKNGKLLGGNYVTKNAWMAVKYVNEKLKELCERDPMLHYFDANHLFIHGSNRKWGESMFIPAELMSDRLHPTAKGYELWGTMILEMLRSLIYKE